MLRLYNTLTKQKEEFVPLYPGKAGMYVCGPTVYGPIHIGNIRAYLFADTARRVLENAGYEVRLIKNITDVGHLTEDALAQGDEGEDKVAKQARAEGKTPLAIAAFFEEYFHETEKSMNILPAHFFPRATAHIREMLSLIGELITRGHAYEKNGNVFLDVKTFPEYGRLSGNTLEKLQVGARLERHPDKRNPWDFALWLQAPAGHLMHWPSPWSEGYPGWHIECSAMSMEYLGDTIDIHTGGEDNIFPHHEAEIVQSEGVTGKPFVRFFLHTRHMLVDGAKMSKSAGNSYTLEDIRERGFTPMDLRMLFLGVHYRSQMNFTWDALEQAKKNREKLENAYGRLEKSALLSETSGLTGASSWKRFQSALEDDLNSPEALSAALFVANWIHTALDKQRKIHPKTLEVLTRMFLLFGLARKTEEIIPSEIEVLAKKRESARAARDFAESDRLRDEILSRGYKIEDGPEGYQLKIS